MFYCAGSKLSSSKRQAGQNLKPQLVLFNRNSTHLCKQKSLFVIGTFEIYSCQRQELPLTSLLQSVLTDFTAKRIRHFSQNLRCLLQQTFTNISPSFKPISTWELIWPSSAYSSHTHIHLKNNQIDITSWQPKTNSFASSAQTLKLTSTQNAAQRKCEN